MNTAVKRIGSFGSRDPGTMYPFTPVTMVVAAAAAFVLYQMDDSLMERIHCNLLMVTA